MQPALSLVELPYYESMKLARMNGWDLRDSQGEPIPWPDLELPADLVAKANFKAFVRATEIRLNRIQRRANPYKGRRPWKRRAAPVEWRRQPVKTWMDFTARGD